MRRLMVVLGLVLLLVATGAFTFRWFQEPGRYARNQHNSPAGWRGVSEPRSGSWRDNRSGPSSGWTGRGGGVSGLRLFEIMVDLLNVVVGIGGICLAIIGVRMQRAANRRMSLRTDT